MLELGEPVAELVGEPPAEPTEPAGEEDEPVTGPAAGVAVRGDGDGELLGAVAVETLMLTFCPAAQWPVYAQM